MALAAARLNAILEILEGALDIEPARWTKADQMRVGVYLKTRQWERYQARKSSFREWRYRKPGTD
jgi:putative DNA primase/helicase